MKYTITEYDRDYNTVTDFFDKEFSTREQAEEWCRNESWTGYSYHVTGEGWGGD